MQSTNTDLKKKKKDCRSGERGDGENGEKERKERAVRKDLICKTFYLIFKWLAYKLSLRGYTEKIPYQT